MAELLKWYQRAGSCADVVCSTRVRLARNLKHYPFPAYASVEQKEEIEQKVKDAMLSGEQHPLPGVSLRPPGKSLRGGGGVFRGAPPG